MKRFFINPFTISLVVAALLLSGLFFGSLRWLDDYTNHGKEIIVPDLHGLDEEEAEKVLTDKKLAYEIIDSIFVKGEKAGAVIEQTPEAGSPVKEDRKIYLTINARSPRQVVLPDLRDVSLRQAEAIITSIGLKAGEYEYVPSEYKDLVQDVKYNGEIAKPGARITDGATITLLVGKGLSDETTVVVSLRGLTLEQAIDQAHAASLNIGAALYDVEPQNEKEKAQYFVYKQEPVTGSEVSLGQAIKLFFTTDKKMLEVPEEKVEIPSAEEENLWE
ncbi:MAG: PASTA domain-containing protein [Prevotellaceae bacterium]|jgi:beta-lactam-binding protein with PASTA domain|nr:PASTA domain-containing protein [Prevotellaceae bacterium]